MGTGVLEAGLLTHKRRVQQVTRGHRATRRLLRGKLRQEATVSGLLSFTPLVWVLVVTL